ncbi:MAG TPA: DoxX family protein [Ktedonobacteraceae bacterium]|nr:DoxX family protein [Ktedonobacteraceae bacterium]
MNIALWIVQALIALVFFVVGFMKAFLPLETLAKPFQWVPSFPSAFVRFLGICEMLGAIGMVLPPLAHILPWLAIAAAVGLILTAGGGTVVHLSRREYRVISINLVLIVLSLFIIYGRVALAPF